MNIPDKVKIGWRNYKVMQGEDRRDEKGNMLIGQIDYDSHTIYLKKNIIDEDEKCLSFLHEILHGIFYSEGQTKLRSNEDLIMAISEGLYQVIKDNPDMFKDSEAYGKDKD